MGAFNTKQVSNRLEALKDARKKTRPGPPDFLTRFLTAHEENPQKMTSGDLIVRMIPILCCGFVEVELSSGE